MTDIPELGAEDQALLASLAELPTVEPIPGAPERFRARVAAHRTVHRGPSVWVVTGLAAVLVLMLAGGWQIDRRRQEAEAGRLRAELVLALNNLSAVTRTEAISTAAQSGVHDVGVAEALVVALLHDPNTNVRVAAAEALGRIAPSAILQQAVGRSIVSESSPFVQAALLSATRRFAPAERAALVKILLARQDLDPTLRDQARQISVL